MTDARATGEDTVPTRVEALVEGDLVDLEGDEYAGESPEYEFEYGVVDGFEVETPTCTRVDFSNYESIGFPTGYEVRRVQRG